jgi:two-component system sensor histidine kinase UhpB
MFIEYRRSPMLADLVATFSRLRETLNQRWRSQSVRRQIMISISTISIGAILLSMLLAVLDARGRVEAEVNSSMELTQQLVRDMVKRVSTRDQLNELLDDTPAQLKYVRHARIIATNSKGELEQIAPDENAKEALKGRREQIPSWFRRLAAPPVTTREVRVLSGSDALGSVQIVSQPDDELGEVWEEVSRRAVLWLGITLVMLALLYVVLGRLLNPLVGLASGMHELEDGRYSTRLPEPPMRELAAIAQRFNTLAGALEKAKAENSRLYRHLIGVQEDERRQVANELHDEAGPCLFGITANLSSIDRLVEGLAAPDAVKIKTRTGEILSIAQRLKTINRDLLRRLRPVELGRIPLHELIASLVAGFERRHPDVTFRLATGSLAQGYGEAVDLTLFRCVQEALTNAMQHGGATRVDVEIGEKADAAGTSQRISLLVRDNGKGFAACTPAGIGLTAMRERVLAINGSSHIESSPTGTVISVSVLLPAKHRPPNTASDALEGVTE